MNTELPTIPLLKEHQGLKVTGCREISEGQLEITITGGTAENRRAAAAQLTGGRTAIIRDGVTTHVGGGMFSSIADSGTSVTVTVHIQ